MRLRHAPLVHVLAQVVFSPVLQWEEHAAVLQPLLAELGYVRLRRGQMVEVNFGPGAPTEQRTVQRFDFSTRDQRSAFVLSEASFVLHTAAYLDKAPFLATFQRGLEALQEAMPVHIVERIGFRFIDLVQPDAGEPFGRYVHAGLLGFPFRDVAALQATTRGFATQSVAMTPHGALAIRSGVLPPGQYLPPDLDTGTLLRPENHDPNRPGLAVDFDHFTLFSEPGTPTLDFEPEAIIRHLQVLHTPLREAFHAIVTRDAIDRWGPWEPVPAEAEEAMTA